MEKVDIYLYSNVKSIKGQGFGVYVLEAPDIPLKEGSNPKPGIVSLEGTKLNCVLTLLKCALERIRRPSNLHIYTDDVALYGDLINNLPIWIESNWITKRGTEVKNKELWLQIWGMLKCHVYEVELSKDHKFYKWQQFEAERRKNGNHKN